MAKPIDKIAALIDQFAGGIDEHRYTTVFLLGKKFVVFKVAGHMRWDGRWQPQAYEPVKYMLVRQGCWWMASDTEIKEWKGRVSFNELKKALDAEEDKELASHGRDVRKLPVPRRG